MKLDKLSIILIHGLFAPFMYVQYKTQPILVTAER